jgi:hypothetical protein
MTRGTCTPRLSVIVAIGDVEDSIGRDVRSMARQLRARGIPFEILAASDGSCDTSMVVLQLLRTEIPELSLLGGTRPGRVFRRAVAHARGEAVLLFEARRGTALPYAILGWALSRLNRRAAVIVRSRFVLAHRLRALPVLLATVGRGSDYEARFERRASNLGLDLEIAGKSRRAGLSRSLLSPMLRLLSV